MKFIRTHFANVVILIIFAVGIYIRAAWYGDLRLSTANAETDSYISASRASIFSWKIFAGQRLFTTNLIFKMANDSANCPINSFGKPGIGEEAERAVQPCFDKIALLQNYLSIFGWCFLGWMLARWLSNPFVKIFAAVSVMTFGFTPQVAEWDSVLSPESLSLSMFAILLGLALEVVLRAASSDVPFASRADKILLAVSVAWYLLWVFVRDVHLYAIPVTLALFIPLFFLKKFRASRPLHYATTALVFFFIVGYLSARGGHRATVPVGHALAEYILPYPARVEFLEGFGMPDSDSPAYMEWVDDDGAMAYGLFLLEHPGFLLTTLWEEMDSLGSDFIQPYFLTDEVMHRGILLTVGEMVNPETPAIFLLSLVMLLILPAHLWMRGTPALAAWTWLAFWCYGIAAATLLLGYFGDTGGLRRHIMPSVEMARLCLWIFLLPFLDLSLSEKGIRDA